MKVYEQYINESDKGKKIDLDREMADKYGILYPVPPDSDDNPFPKIGELTAPVQVEFSKKYLKVKGDRCEVENFKSSDVARYLDEKRFLKLKIDTNFKKETILEEVKIAIDQIFNALENENLKTKHRYRLDKYPTYFIVWDSRKKKTSFSKIAEETNQSVDTCKKQFYLAWELINEKKYDPEAFKRSEITKSMLKETCDNCPDYESCDTLCPDAMAFADQDKSVCLGITSKKVDTHGQARGTLNNSSFA